jgi:hypothetical protein
MVAQYEEEVRQYTIRYVNPKPAEPEVLQETVADYGSVVPYNGNKLPVYTGEESAYTYYLFSGWDQSGYVNGDKIINAQFDVARY